MLFLLNWLYISQVTFVTSNNDAEVQKLKNLLYSFALYRQFLNSSTSAASHPERVKKV